jgi:DnaJ domain
MLSYNECTLEIECRRGARRIAMTVCSCGNATEQNSDRCARCAAFDALELKSDATTEQIHSAYEVLSKAWNPDRFQDDPKMKAAAQERLTAIDAAHSLLVRGTVQAAPFRSAAAGARVEAPLDGAFDKGAAESGRGWRKRGSNDLAGRHLRLPLPLLIGCGVVASGIVVAAILFKPLDSALLGIPVAGKIYAEFKEGIASRVQELKNKVGLGVGSAALAPQEETTAPSAPGTPADTTEKNAPTEKVQRSQPTAKDNSQSRSVASPAGSEPAHERALPFITAGLTRDEVIAAQGAPTAETADEMDYGNSKLYFDKGVVMGWRIDSSSLLRVKLWPDAKVDPNLQTFGMDSTRNEVIVVQGTPTTYSPSMFGYGKSEVYFQYGRVVGWKNDAATPLHTASR